jgi:GTP diphosphokinase / guanosine-3',5'-bis(diphosphate) 3'-diphosphatase
LDYSEQQISSILTAVKLSAERHRDQRRKDAAATPYINHPVQVAELLWRVGGVRDVKMIIAGLLHDLLEDTETAPEEIRRLFGDEVWSLVLEVTDDKSLPKSERKRLQIKHAPHLSTGAKQIKLADKICNVVDITNSPPHNWSVGRKRDYLEWSERVVAGLGGCNQMLEDYFARVLRTARETMEG